jgi:hypothetical protein
LLTTAPHSAPRRASLAPQVASASPLASCRAPLVLLVRTKIWWQRIFANCVVWEPSQPLPPRQFAASAHPAHMPILSDSKRATCARLASSKISQDRARAPIVRRDTTPMGSASHPVRLVTVELIVTLMAQ